MFGNYNLATFVVKVKLLRPWIVELPKFRNSWLKMRRNKCSYAYRF